MTMSSANRKNAIRVEELAVSYDGQTLAVQNVTCEVAPGEFVAVLGPSGCGKSTILQVLSGLLGAAQGRAYIEGREVGAAGNEPPRVGYVFQDHRLLPWRRVDKNIELALKAAGIPKSEWDARIGRYLDMLQLGDHRRSWPMKMSGGQRQRVSIARALAIDPPVILMDEPFSTLDEVTARTLRQELLNVWNESGTTILFVTHSIREALFLADRVLILTRGPATLLEDFTVPLERPRIYEDPKLTDVESKLVDRVMEPWGYGVQQDLSG